MPPVKPRRLTDSLPCVLPGTRTRLVPGFLFAPTKERAILNIYVDTCVLPRAHLEEARIYREQFGDQLGFELLAMFDLPDFEENLKKNLDFFSSVPLMFHEPVWGVEHTAPRGSTAWEDGMYHIRLGREVRADPPSLHDGLPPEQLHRFPAGVGVHAPHRAGKPGGNAGTVPRR